MIRKLLATVGLVGLGVGVLLVLPRCGSQYALLLNIRAQESSTPPTVFDLRVKDIASGQIVLERVGEKVDPDDPNRDISKKGQELKVAVEFASAGNYLVYIWARSGQGVEGSQFYLRDFQVEEVLEKDVLLVPLVGDADGDGFPACGATTVTCGPINCNFLDCNDDPSDALAVNIHPFAVEVCENGRDDDCSAGCGAAPGAGDAPCVDNDGDGVPSGPDCDDNDPCKSPKLKEAENTCGTTAADWDNEDSRACKELLAKQGKPFIPPFCGDGIDQDCNGKDVACREDKDCDGYSPPQDCDDNDPKVSPKAPEVCGDGKDNDCDGDVDEGCIPCDVDGDGHADPNHTGGLCNLPKDDDDDYDAGVHPDTTKSDSGKEGGTVLGALREYCSSAKEKNGVLAHRDVDHDGDKLPASGDGCPTVTCDADGDGFQGAQCNPPAPEKDCNDADPKVFPGAPDLCGDGIAQNCVSDKTCGTDADGDKYFGADDCDDSRADVHPWATEKCDSVDNDCDGLTDEGNPDPAGVPIATDANRTIKCNNDPDGKCAPLIGICACSRIDTSKKDYNNGYPLDASRTLCPGEAFTVPASPRCFGANRPEQERCDTDDWNCNGNPFNPVDANADPTKNDYKDYGLPCGTSVGQCKAAGIVTGCNLQQTLSSQVLSVLGAGYNQHWICTNPLEQQPVQLPVKEECNGFDDDCDGYYTSQDVSGTDKGWPELDEKDVDGDKYMACSGCGGLPLASGLLGCDDCKDGVPSIFPTAYEACDGIDNNCKSGDEGTGQCKPPVTCCPSQKACRNLSTDFQNCGSCGNVCNADVTNHCVGGSCMCGGTGPCTGSRNCNQSTGVCECIQGGLCAGCCDGNTCRTGNTTTYCGKGGESCDACTTTNPCQTPVCNSNRDCTTTPKSNGTPCPGGQCRNGNCCTGCWDGSTCRSGTDNAFCGDNGDFCSPCSTTNPCRSASCSTGTCNITYNPNGSSCPSGKCYGGNCCTGCWDGSTCRTGTTTTYCGLAGNDCGPCASTNPCKTAACPLGTCLIGNVNDGDSCPSGKCYGGSCCTGCWDGNSCEAGNTAAVCGDDGEACVGCTAGPCKDPVCNSGSCGTVNEPNGNSCSGGLCYGGSCCTGCWTGTSCVGGTTPPDCGDNGVACTTCYTTDPCKTATCPGGSCQIVDKGDGTPCSGGVCRGGGCCTGCWDGDSCEPGTAKNACGTAGEICDACTGSDICENGNCVSGPTLDAGVPPPDA